MNLATGTYRADELRPLTGAGVRIVVVDSGVHAVHPHIGGVAGGVGVSASGELGDDFADRLGHGTAVTAVIREKAPGAEVLVARVFERRLDTTVEALVAAIGWASAQRADLVNLSLGTANPVHETRLASALHHAAETGAHVVAADTADGVRWLPGSLAQAIGVSLEWSLGRDAVTVDSVENIGVRMRASGYPRPIPGVSPERNLKGLSFAVANATGLLALLLERQRRIA